MTAKEALEKLRETVYSPFKISDKEKKECVDVLDKALIKLEKVEEVIYFWKRGKYGFSHSANELHIKDIRDILEEK